MARSARSGLNRATFVGHQSCGRLYRTSKAGFPSDSSDANRSGSDHSTSLGAAALARQVADGGRSWAGRPGRTIRLWERFGSCVAEGHPGL